MWPFVEFTDQANAKILLNLRHLVHVKDAKESGTILCFRHFAGVYEHVVKEEFKDVKQSLQKALEY